METRRLAAVRLAAGLLAAGRLAAVHLAAGRLAAGLLAAGLLAAVQNIIFTLSKILASFKNLYLFLAMQRDPVSRSRENER